MAIHIGQCFTKAGVPYPDVWQVVGIVSLPGCREAHARLARIEHPADCKTVALAALEDARFFQPHDPSRVLRRRLGRRMRA